MEKLSYPRRSPWPRISAWRWKESATLVPDFIGITHLSVYICRYIQQVITMLNYAHRYTGERKCLTSKILQGTLSKIIFLWKWMMKFDFLVITCLEDRWIHEILEFGCCSNLPLTKTIARARTRTKPKRILDFQYDKKSGLTLIIKSPSLYIRREYCWRRCSIVMKTCMFVRIWWFNR